MIIIDVPGIPVGQGSKRHVGNGIMVESSAGLMPWRDSIIAAVRSAVPDRDDWLFRGPVEVSLIFTFDRPKAHYGTGRNANVLKSGMSVFKRTKPDLDKLVRAVLDAVTQAGGVWQDDAQVAALYARKEFGRPGLSIMVGGL